MIIKKTDVGGYPPIVELGATPSEVYLRGEGLVITAGLATKCGASVKPTHICEEDYKATATKPRPLKAHSVYPHNFYEVAATAALISNAVGSLVCLDATGTKVTTTADGGVATIVQKATDGLSAVVRFV